MKSLPSELTTHIIEFLPIETQARICTQTRAKVLPMAIDKIKRALKIHRKRILNLMHNETEKLEVLRAAHILYHGDTPGDIQRSINFVIQKSNVFPPEVLSTINAGNKLGWPPKKIYRLASIYFRVQDFAYIGW